MATYCGDVSDSGTPGNVLFCLRGVVDKLGPSCKAQVHRTQTDAVDDYRTDARLHAACADDAKTLCADVEAGDGREVECLVRWRLAGLWRGWEGERLVLGPLAASPMMDVGWEKEPRRGRKFAMGRCVCWAEALLHYCAALSTF